jgi:hypothetical protein
MTVKSQTFDNGTEGATVNATTTAGGGDACDAPIVTASGTCVYRAASAIRGAMGIRISGAAGDGYVLPWTADTPALTFTTLIGFKVDTANLPTLAVWPLMQLRNASAQAAIAVLSTTGLLTIQNRSGAGSGTNGGFNMNGGTPLPDGSYFLRVTGTVATATTGTITAKLYNATTYALIDSQTKATVDLGTANITLGRIGKTSTTVAGYMDMDLFGQWFNTGTTADLALPPTTISLTPESSTLTPVAVTPTPQPVTISLTPATASLTPVAVSTAAPSSTTLTPVTVTLTPTAVTAQATTSVADDFNSYTAGNVLGSPWITHSLATGTFTVQSGGGSIRATSATTAIWTHPLIADFADGTVEADIKFLSGSGYTSGVCGRVNASALTFYSARMNNSGALELVKSVAGTVTALGSQYIVNLAVNATIRVGLRMSGSSIVVTGNGVDRISVTDTSVTAAGRVGIRATGGSTTTAGLHFDNFAAAAAVASAMPTTEISGYVIDTSCDFTEGDFAEGDIVMMTTGDLGKINPTSVAGALYASKWKTKQTGAIPNESLSDYDAPATMSVVNGILRMRQHFVSGRGKAGAIKPLLSGSNPNGENYIAYPRIRVRYRKTATPPTGSTAVGWGGIAIEMIGSATDWAAGGGEYGLAEGSFVSDAQGGSPLGVWVRDSDHQTLPNRSGHPQFYRADTAGAPSGENDWHIGELRSEPGRMRVFIDGVVIYDDTVNPPIDTDLFGLLSQNGKPGTPSAGTEGLMEWDWYVVSRYVGATMTLTPATVTASPVAVTPSPLSATVNLTPVPISLLTIPVSSTPTVNLVPITVTLFVPQNPSPDIYSDFYLQGIYPVAIGGATLTPDLATLTPVAVAPVPGEIAVSLTPATMTTSTLALDPVALPPERDLSLPDIDVVVEAIPVTPIPGATSVTLTPVTVAVLTVTVQPGAIGVTTVTTATATLTTVTVDPVAGTATTSAFASVTVTAVAVTPIPSLITINLTPAIVTASALALSPAGQPVVTSLTTRTVTATAVVVAPVPQAVTVNLVARTVTATPVVVVPFSPTSTVSLIPASVAAVSSVVSPVGQAGVVNLATRTVTATPVAVTPIIQPVNLPLTPAVVSAVAVALDAQGQPGIVNLGRTALTLSTQPVTPVPQIIITALREAVDTLTPISLAPVAGGVVSLTPITVSTVEVAVTPVPGAVAVSLTPVVVRVTAQLVGAQARVDLTPAIVALSTQPVTQTPGLVTTTLTTKTVPAVAVAVTPVPSQIPIGAGTAAVTVAPVAVTPVPVAPVVSLLPALVYVSPWAVGILPPGQIDLTAAVVTFSATTVNPTAQTVTTTLTTATVTLTNRPLDPVGLQVQLYLTTATLTMSARPLGLVPGGITISLQTVTATLSAVPVAPGAPVGPAVPRVLVAVLRDRGRYDATMSNTERARYGPTLVEAR